MLESFPSAATGISVTGGHLTYLRAKTPPNSMDAHEVRDHSGPQL